MKSGKVLLGILAGTAVGALVGVLFAPEKGSKTRKRILNKSEDYADTVKDKLNDFMDDVTKKYESVWHQAELTASKGKAKYDEIKKETEKLNA